MREVGRVYLVGAGPGDPELLTVKAARLIAAADVLVHDRLVADCILDLAPPLTARVPVGKEPHRHPVPQQEINKLLVRLARRGHDVVRLKGGDPFIFGRGSEEAEVLARAGVPFEIVPGITAAQGCAASSLVPLTHRGVASGVRYVTGHARDDEPLDLDWRSLADPQTTLVVYMGVARIRQIAAQLVEHGLPFDTPVLAVAKGTRPDERRLRARLCDIADRVAAAGLTDTVTFFIGRVAGLDLGAALDRPPLRLVEPQRERARA